MSRVTTLGELTASIAHEVNQPSGAMVASAGACARWLAADPPAMAEARARSTASSPTASGRAKSSRGSARSPSARRRARTGWTSIRRFAKSSRSRSTSCAATTSFFGQTLGETLPPVVGDRVQLQQVLLNLIVNAIEAMSAVHDRPRELAIVSRQDGPDAVLVEVRDSGSGLDPQGAEQVFEAFYTTKPEGIGIGLSISRSIIEAHGGRLWASANAPHGAVFRFLAARHRGGSLMNEDRAVVFVVDDDPSMRALARQRCSGRSASTCGSSPRRRSSCSAQRPDAPGCLVLDVRLPGMSGLTFQQELAKAGVALPVIFITGHGDVPMTVRAMKAGAVEFLTKPFDDQALLDAIHAAIERDRARRREAASLAELHARYHELTERERQVMTLVAAGRANKQIAAELGLSLVTVKVHRGQVMRKMQARSVAELVRMADRLGLPGTA